MPNEIIEAMRRLPVYLLLDCSGSMAGEPIAAMEMGLRQLLNDLKNDPQALETVWLSVIAFSSTAEQVAPLSDLTDFDPPDLEASGATHLGEAVTLLAECIEDEVRHTTPDQKGDWRPFVFIFTDGEPNDDWGEPVDDFRARGVADVVACGAGPEVEDAVLKRLSDTVIRLEDTQPGTLGTLIKWLTESVTTRSKSLGTQAKSEEMLPELPDAGGIRLLP